VYTCPYDSIANLFWWDELARLAGNFNNVEFESELLMSDLEDFIKLG